MTRIDNTSPTPRPTTTQASSIGAFMKGAVPSNVTRADELGKDAVKFQMQNGAQKMELAWDKASDKMFARADGKLTEVPADVKQAAIARLSEAGLAGVRKDSLYSGMRDDMLKSTRATVAPQKAPPLPVMTTPDKLSTAITPRPLEAVPTARPFEPLPTSSVSTGLARRTEEPIAPLPAAFKSKVGAASRRDLEGALEKAPDARTATAWVQELMGAKGKAIDGKFGPSTAQMLQDEPTVVQGLRDMHVKDTAAAAKKAPLSPMSPRAKEQLKTEMTSARDRALVTTTEPGSTAPFEAAVTQMQKALVRAGEPMAVDGKLGKQTVESLERHYGKQVAGELVRHANMLKSEDGDM
jgi:hypothetical protein